MMLLSRFRRAAPCGLFGLLIACVAPTGWSAPEWRILRTPRFTLITQGREREAQQWAEDFNQFIDALQDVIRVKDVWLPPQTMVIFRRERDFRPYVPLRPDGKPADVAGFYGRRETWSVMGLTDAMDNEGLRRVIFHEGVHWFMSASPDHQPLWLSEGLAEVYSTFRVLRGQTRWGEPIQNHVLQLRDTRPLPMERLLWMGREDPMFNESERTSVFYAQSWAFVHYLLFGHRTGERSALVDYLRASRTGEHPDVVFRNVFGTDYAGMDRRLADYLRGGKYFIGGKPAVAADLGGARFEPAPPATVEAALARLAMASKRYDLARSHAERAITLAPEDPDAWSALAVVRTEAGDEPDARREALERAIALGTTDVWCRVARADLLLDEALSTGGVLPRVARQIANEFEIAINQRPVTLLAYVGLARIAGALEDATAEDVKFLRQGRELFPDEPALALGLADLLHQTGNYPAAQESLNAALARAGALSPSARDYARLAGPRWRYEIVTKEAQAAAEAGDFETALAQLATLEGEPLPIPMRQSVGAARREFEGRRIIAQAIAALEAGDPAEAMPVLRGLADDDATSPGVRRHARQLLERLAPPEP